MSQERLRACFLIALSSALVWAAGTASGETPRNGQAGQRDVSSPRPSLRVGPLQALKSPSEAAAVAIDGDTIEVESGDYVGDVAVWHQNNLVIKSIGGRVRLRANGVAAEGKGIWVVRGGSMTVEGFDFSGAKVADRNGAGIRFEKGSLTVRDCTFMHNEMGILTNNTPDAELTVENSEFAHNMRPDGHNHNLYVGRIARLSVTGSYFHHGFVGHLLKSRAAINHVLYNRLTDEADGRASYELEFPDGGIAYVIGNTIEQSRLTENSNLISFGAEGYKWPTNEIYLVNNTLINNKAFGGTFLRVWPGAGTIAAVNNVLVGYGALEPAGRAQYRNNVQVDANELERDKSHGFRLKSGSPWIGRAVDPGWAGSQDLRQKREYVHPRATRKLSTPAHNPGAFQSPAATSP